LTLVRQQSAILKTKSHKKSKLLSTEWYSVMISKQLLTEKSRHLKHGVTLLPMKLSLVQEVWIIK
jgi:hypothetical protein